MTVHIQSFNGANGVLRISDGDGWSSFGFVVCEGRRRFARITGEMFESAGTVYLTPRMWAAIMRLLKWGLAR